jgi:hypothetical protein
MNIALGTVASATAIAVSSPLAPAMPAPVTVPVPPAPIEPDPIFAALAEHRRLWAIYGRALTKYDEAQGEIRERPSMSGRNWRAAERAWRKRHGLTDLYAEQQRTGYASEAALLALAKIKPSTPPGAAALIDYVIADM